VPREMVGGVILAAGSGDGDPPDLIEEAIEDCGQGGRDEVAGGRGRGCGHGCKEEGGGAVEEEDWIKLNLPHQKSKPHFPQPPTTLLKPNWF